MNKGAFKRRKKKKTEIKKTPLFTGEKSLQNATTTAKSRDSSQHITAETPGPAVEDLTFDRVTRLTVLCKRTVMNKRFAFVSQLISNTLKITRRFLYPGSCLLTGGGRVGYRFSNKFASISEQNNHHFYA